MRDVNDRLNVTSELRFAIFDAFKKFRIEIPFPQRDLHIIRDPDEDVDSREGRPVRADSSHPENALDTIAQQERAFEALARQ